MKGIIKRIFQSRINKNYSCMRISGDKEVFQVIRNDKIQELGVEVGKRIEDILDKPLSVSLTKDTERLKNLIEKSEKKLNNQNFLDRAPGEIIEKERQKLDSFKAQLSI